MSRNGQSTIQQNGPTVITTNNNNGSFSSFELSEEFMNCPVCKKTFETPKLLPCLHSFCERCLQNSLQASGIQQGQAFLCPLCRNDCVLPKKGVSALPSNVFIETLQKFRTKKTGVKKQTCQGCETDVLAEVKCIECDDWLCKTCVKMHQRVKVTKTHHLASKEELNMGEHDNLLKDQFEALICGKHVEPLKLYCTESTCLTPICTVCKSTLGHDGHRAIPLEQQATTEVSYIRTLIPGLQARISAVSRKIDNINQEDQMTAAVRKDMHKHISERLKLVTEAVIKELSSYAEHLHKEVDRIATEHKQELDQVKEDVQFDMKALLAAQTFTSSLLDFGRSEEVVVMARPVSLRLNDFQEPISTIPPSWRHPRMHPAEIPPPDQISAIFGKLTFAGEVTRCVLVKSFSAKTEYDNKDCNLSDLTVTEDNDIVVVDKDNRRIKVFDMDGNLLFATRNGLFKAPNRIVSLPTSEGNLLVKDEKTLHILRPNGQIGGKFPAKTLQHPVAMCIDRKGDLMITDWMTGCVHIFNMEGVEVKKFSSNLEAPAYVTTSPAGNSIVLSDWKQNIIRMYDEEGRTSWQYSGSSESNPDSSLNHPYGVCTDRFGHVLIADNWNNRIHMLSGDGSFLRLLLTKDDGLNFPQALATDSKGRLVVAEIQGQIKVYQYIA